MKNIILVILTTILSVSVWAQAPQQFNYQGVARDLSGNPLPGQTIGLQFSILSGSATGAIEYSEEHSVVTNSLGLFSLHIGSSNNNSGSFSTIDWGNNSHYLKVEMDESGGTSYSHIGTSQLVSVPYAFYAESGGEWEYDGMGINSKNRNIAINTVNTNPQHIVQGNKDNSEFRVRMGTSIGGYASQVFIGTGEPNAVAGFVLDAIDGDGIGIDYGTIYQFSDGKIEINNRGNNDIVFATNNQERMRITNSGDLYVQNSSNGIIMRSPNGDCWKMTVDNSGQPVFTSISCP